MPGIQLLASPIILVVIMALAVREDVVSHRIPNVLTLTGLVFGIALQAHGGGLDGLGWSIAGAAVGFACFLPLYLCKGMGAGDVKLMMAAGAFLGPIDAFVGSLLSLVAGAALAILVVARRLAVLRSAPAAAGNTTTGGAGLRSALARATSERFPYAAAIAIGVVATMWLRGLFKPLAASLT